MARRRKTEGEAWLAARARTARRLHASIVGAGLLGTALGVAQAWCIARLLAPALGGPAADARAWGSAFAALALLRVGLAYLTDRLGFEAGASVRRRLRTLLLATLFARSPAEVDRSSPGALAALAVDGIEALDGYFGRWLPAAALAIAGPALVAVVVLFVDPVAALELGAAGLLVPLGMALAGLGAAAASRHQFVAMGRLQARFLDRVRGIATIVLAGQAEAEARQLQVAADELTRRTMRVLRVAFLSSAALDAAAAAALVLLAIRFGLRANAGVIADPARALFPILLVAEFFAPLRAFAASYQDRLQAHEVSGQIAAIQPEPAPETQPLAVRTVRASGVTVAFENVSLTHDPTRGKVLDQLSFRVPAGETAVLIGPSGAGKTTVLELLLGFLR
ncbi:MAG: ATP-binding cassette domain-containing protein, partial [Acetobacteraceae bacterium]|nr:ATP-binding cassette domain-containing protein [Acetobacteraceae bacterium]